MRRARIALLLPALAAATGWRGDGSGTYPRATPPDGALGAPTWQIELPGWSNAGPVLVGDRICAPSEPTTLTCVDAATGRSLWQKTSDYADTLPATELAAWYQQLARYYADEEAFDAARREVSELRRALRSASPPPDTSARLEQVTQRMDQLRASIEAVAVHLTPADKEIIGYTSSSPVTDGRTIYALFGNGVVSAFAADGARRWSRWIGAPPGRMNGYNFGTSSSLVLADGVLVVPYGKLRGLDPATGAQVWAANDVWRHFGTPAVVTVDGVAWLATPDGRLIRARDGEQGAAGLGEMWFTSPYASGDTVWYVGGTTSGDMVGHVGVPARGWRVTPSGDGVTATKLWETMLQCERSMYTPPILRDGQLWVVDAAAAVRVIDAATGALQRQLDALPERPGTIFSPPALADDRIWILGEQGVLQTVDPAGSAVVAGHLSAARAPLTFDGRALYVRTLRGLSRYDGDAP